MNILNFLVKKKLISKKEVVLTINNLNDYIIKIELNPYSEKHPLDINRNNFFIEKYENVLITFYNKKYSYVTIVVMKKGNNKHLINKTIMIKKSKIIRIKENKLWVM